MHLRPSRDRRCRRYAQLDRDDSAHDPAHDATAPPPSDSGLSDSGAVYRALAAIRATTDAGAVNGTVTFTETNNEVVAVVSIAGATPPGLHGLHIHQGDNCLPTTSDAGVVTPGGGAGPHWNPTDAGHGNPASGAHHLGDMGNIPIADGGTGTLTFTSKDWRVLGTGPNSVVGHAIVFHAGQDDLVSQPVGDAGARPGCGVIQRAP